MEYNYYVYEKLEANIKINSMPKWFKEISFEGNENEGTVVMHSNDEYDEYWGANAKLDISWEKKARGSFFFSKEIQRSIDSYNGIGVVVLNKENTWHLSHEFTYWYGKRTKMLHKRFYPAKCIHGIFYCDMTERLFNIHTEIIDKFYENFKPFMEKSFISIVCHGE
jgi:hypothetical protein